MDLHDLETLVDYHYWARDRVLDAAALLTPDQLSRDLGSSFKSVRDTLTHVYAAERVWCSRWQGTSPTSLNVGEFQDVASLRLKWSELEVDVRRVLQGLGKDGIARVMSYSMLSGEPRRSVFWHMLQHVVNHASYHRGQVTTMLRQLGAAPPQQMDLITFYRARE